MIGDDQIMFFTVSPDTYIEFDKYHAKPVEWRFDRRERRFGRWSPNSAKTGVLLHSNDEDYEPIFLQNMKECNTLIIRFNKDDRSAITMQFSLEGFTEKYNELIRKAMTTP